MSGLAKVTITAGKGTTGLQAPGKDYISGLVFYANTLPSGFSTATTAQRMAQLFSVADAESKGILDDYSDETKAVAICLITNSGATGDAITLYWTEPDGTVVTLGSYTNLASDTIETVVDGLVAAINALTPSHGYTAEDTGDTETTVFVTARKGLGIHPNSGTPLTKVVTGAMAGTITQPTGSGGTVLGVASLLALWHYHISEYFRLNPNGNLFVGFFAIPASAAAYNYNEVATLQNFAQGEIRNFGVYAPKNYAAAGSDVTTFISNAMTALQTQYTTIYGLHQPGQILFATDLAKLSGIANLTLDLSLLAATRVSNIIFQDGAALGNTLYLTTGYSISGLGAALGVLSLSAVSDDIGDLSQFNMTSGSELSVPAFADGTLLKNVANSLITQLDLYRHIFLLTYQGYSGVYINNDHVACPYNNQFAYIHFGRTWDKASRQLYAAYIPFLKAKFSLNADGTLSPTTLSTLTQAGNQALDGMVRDNDLSGYTVTVPSNQNPNTTGKLLITVNLLAEAIANEIDITSTFVASL